ncbi:hypothetical protein ACKWTF_002872 [Chironomus riparius]
MLIRILFILMSLLILVQSAPSPYFTRSFVKTPSSTYEQYLIVPDKSDAYRVPLSQVHHYSDFQFPKQQVVYYNPSTGTNQHRLQALKNDNPLWQEMLMNLHGKSDENMLMNDAEMSKMSTEHTEMNDNSEQKVMNEDTMRMILDQENPSSDMMEKLKRDDTKMSEMMKVLAESTTFTPKISIQQISVPSNEDMTREEMSSMNDETEQMSDQNDGEVVPNMMELTQNSTNQIMRASPQIHPEMTRVIVPDLNILEIKNENLIEAAENAQSSDSEELNEIQTETPLVSRIAELISNVEPLEMSTVMNRDIQEVSTTEQPPLRRSKDMTLEIMRNIKDHPEVMIKIVELAAASIQEMESNLRNESMENEERSTEQSTAVTETSRMESTESSEALIKADDQVNMLESSTVNPVNEFSTESIESSRDIQNILMPSEPSVSDDEIKFSTETSITSIETSTQVSSESSVPQVQSRLDGSMILTENSEPEIDNSNEEVDVPSASTQISMQNVLETTERVESFSEPEEVRADLPESAENNAETTQITELTPSSTESLQSEQMESSTQLEQLEIIQSSTEPELFESSETTEVINTINDESTEAINAPTTESTILKESSSIESSGMIQQVQIIQISMTSKTDNSDQVNSTMTENIEQSVTRSDIPLNANDNESNGNKVSSSEEQTSSDSGERESDSKEEQITLQEAPQSESGETMREGRVNKAPTMFLHNNRFYVISGVPEFYANFDAYQNPRTPIFSLQELQPIRPMNNVAIQNIEPFRIYVEDNEEQKASTQDDNEPFKIQSSTTDNLRSDIENTQSINMEQKESKMQREMTVKVKKRVQDRQSTSEAKQDNDDEEEPSVAQASPEATSISGRGGVASAGPKGTALSNKGGISVASPRATAIAGKFKFNDSDDGIDVDFEDDVKVQNRRRVQAAKRKIIRGRRNW